MGILIKKIREKCAYTQVELAKATGITNVQLSRIESGYVRVPEETLETLAYVLNVDPIELLILCIIHPLLEPIQKKLRKKIG